jgi:hypothetical protein
VLGALPALPAFTTTEIVVGALVAAFVVLRGARSRVRWFALGALATAGAAVALFGVPHRGTTVSKLVEPSAVVVAARRKPVAPSSSPSGSVLNDDGFAKMRAGDYREALPLLEQAVKRLDRTGSLVEAYALYNLSATRFALGHCTGVLSMLDRSQKLQGRRPEIDSLRARARDRCLKH